MRVLAYTDGAANNARPLEHRPGGWAVVMMLVNDKGERDPRPDAYKELSGGVPSATTNEMELEAIRQALLALKGRAVPITIYSDSAYAIGACSKTWKLKHNLDLVREIRELIRQHRVSFEKVKGHAGIEHNERADQLAVSERRAREYPLEDTESA